VALSTPTRSSCSRCRGWPLHAHDKHSACNDQCRGDATCHGGGTANTLHNTRLYTMQHLQLHSCSTLPCHPPSCDSPTAAACAAPRMGNRCAAWTTLSPPTGEAAWLARGAAAGEAPAAASSGGTCLQQKTRHRLGCPGITCQKTRLSTACSGLHQQERLPALGLNANRTCLLSVGQGWHCNTTCALAGAAEPRSASVRAYKKLQVDTEPVHHTRLRNRRLVQLQPS